MGRYILDVLPTKVRPGKRVEPLLIECFLLLLLWQCLPVIFFILQHDLIIYKCVSTFHIYLIHVFIIEIWHIHNYVHIHMHTWIHILIYNDTYVCVFMCVCVHVVIYTCIYVCNQNIYIFWLIAYLERLQTHIIHILNFKLYWKNVYQSELLNIYFAWCSN